MSAYVAVAIILFEIVAIPFLLGLKLSPAMRVLSMVGGFLVLIFWLAMSLMNVVGGGASQTLGLFGGDILIIPGWWVIWYLVGLTIIQSWVVWGWWPDELTKRKRGKK